MKSFLKARERKVQRKQEVGAAADRVKSYVISLLGHG